MSVWVTGTNVPSGKPCLHSAASANSNPMSFVSYPSVAWVSLGRKHSRKAFVTDFCSTVASGRSQVSHRWRVGPVKQKKATRESGWPTLGEPPATPPC